MALAQRWPVEDQTPMRSESAVPAPVPGARLLVAFQARPSRRVGFAAFRSPITGY